MSDLQLLAMPVERFWLFNGCIDRMNAADDMRRLRIHTSLNNGEAVETVARDCEEVTGTVIVKDFERDEGGINRLKMLIS